MSLISESKSPLPPPSPIPTAKGSRSAANEILTEYLDKSLHVPDLILPEPHIPVQSNTPRLIILPEINYPSLESRDCDAEDLLLRCAREFGAFKITSHGISDKELQSLANEADQVFPVLEKTDAGFMDKISWALSGQRNMEPVSETVRVERFLDFSKKMESIASKLDTIVQQLCKTFMENADRKQFVNGADEKDSILCLYRYEHKRSNSFSDDTALSLHFPATQTRFLVQSAQGPLSFDAESNTIVVTIGKLMEECGMRGFNCVSGEVISKPHLLEDHAANSLLIELKCLSLNFSDRSNNKLSIWNQILIALTLALLYNVMVFLRS